MPPFQILVSLLAVTGVTAFDYAVTGAGDISLTDVGTSIGGIKTIFTHEEVSVTVSGVEWEALAANETTDDTTLYWETFVGGVSQATGTFDLSTLEGRELPSDIECGSVTVRDNGRNEISVTLTVDESTADTSAEFETYAAGVAIIPLIVVLVLAMTTQMVEFSLFFAIFVGACIVAGDMKDGFKALLDTYILEAIADVGHVFVYLFTLFLSGLVGMMEKSGGMIGFTKWIGQYATTPRAGQLATFAIGCIVFFDDYANTLLAGQTMRPLTDLLFISREKLSFVVDATAAPIASISPISSWVGFEVSLIQTEIDRIVEIVGEDNITIDTSGLAVFLQSIKYRYYPIFMLILMPLLIVTQRDFGPMLVAERKTQVYERTDGGDSAGRESAESESMGSNSPRKDTPTMAYNMLVPILLLVFFIFFLLVRSGDDGSGEQSFMDKIEGSDSYVALLWGTMAAANITTLLYMVQVVYRGELVIPTLPIIKSCFVPVEEPAAPVPTKEAPAGDAEEIKGAEEPETESNSARSLMSLFECVEAFLYGMGRIFPALIVLTLAWASGSIMTAVGADRLFSSWITEGVPADMLPTLSFIISLFMALATGTSWGTMTILFPLICLPAYTVSEGDETIFYSTVAGILSGSVAGDHMSPISDTTVLSALATDCTLLAHVTTQAPYAIAMSILAILFGTLPIGRDAWPNIIGILLGAATIGLMVFGLAAPIISPTGRFDVFTMLYMMTKGEDHELHQLKQDTIKKAQGELVEIAPLVTDEGAVAEAEPEELSPQNLHVEVGEPEASATKDDTQNFPDQEISA